MTEIAELRKSKSAPLALSMTVMRKFQNQSNKFSKNQNKKIKHGKVGKKETTGKRGRLIVRNLPFKYNEDDLHNHFKSFGDIKDIQLLRRPDEKLVGCGFVEYVSRLSATKAALKLNGKEFLGRPIIIDWAVSKDRFKQLQEEAVKKEIKKEEDSDEETKPIETVDVTIKEEKMSDKDSDDESDENRAFFIFSLQGNDDGDETSDDEEEEDDKIKEEPEEIKYQRKEDVDEGKTVFVKNLPFSATDEEFKECMEKFGPTFYALVCKDKLTEHFKGSGFVKYKNKEDAEKCLAAGTELKLNGSILDPHPALKRSDIQNINDKSKDKKDNRNLYLVKEGMIVAGTPAAKGVSVGDMEKRLQLEQWKTTKLRNLNMLVSRNRLVIHNLPLGVADRQLRRIFQKHAGPTAVIREARVMRDLNQSDAKGRPVSKGYGFVAFEKHEDALKALRSINNNPSIFNPTQRPIVSFSIENKTVLNVKTKRQLKSQQRNPLSKDYKPDEDGGETVSKKNKKFKREINNSNKDQPQPEYAGMAATPGATVKMRKKFKLQDQAQKHLKDVKKQKQQMKLSRKMRRKEHLQKQKVEKVSSKKKKTLEKDETFSKLVDKYKSKLLSQTNKKKWYE
ncbi:RNA-binding protein 28-like [Macrosteles quadrilineatus]|uniref:RNA-binding protein 28-like n=1 Tax=Macrosteles quadrilineatus TaxID=74068 RepID=UPI0023E2B3E4|nr:RNA-binding protein 28-like [Macrosteles quadrilineatus]